MIHGPYNIKLKLFFDTEAGDEDWIDLAHDRDKWRAVVNTEMKCGKFLD